MPYLMLPTARRDQVILAITICILAGLTILGTSSRSNAGYTCAVNHTQVGNTLTTEVVAVSGGTYTTCPSGQTIGGSSADLYDVSGSVTSTQVGATNGGYFAGVRASPPIGSPLFRVYCTQSGQGGVCNNSGTGTMQGIDVVSCAMEGESFSLPNPALPLVPVTLTTICTFTYTLR